MRPPTFEEAEPGLRLMIGQLPRTGFVTLGELRRQSRLAHLWIQYNEVDLSRVLDAARLRRRAR